MKKLISTICLYFIIKISFAQSSNKESMKITEEDSANKTIVITDKLGKLSAYMIINKKDTSLVVIDSLSVIKCLINLNIYNINVITNKNK